MKRPTITVKAPHLHPLNLIWVRKGKKMWKGERRLGGGGQREREKEREGEKVQLPRA